MDIALDTFPYNGTTTTWCDVADNAGTGTFFIGAISYDGSAGVVKIFMNGALSATDAAAATGQAISANGNLCNNSFFGDIGELIGYTEPLSDADVITVMDEMNATWAVY